MAILIAIGNQKGGCGKTSSTINISGGLVLAGYRVLVVDADPTNSSATMWSLAAGQGKLPFDVVPAYQYRGRFDQLIESPDYDFILVDCAPGVVDSTSDVGKVVRAAIRQADAVLVPLRPSRVDFEACNIFVRYLRSQRQPHQHVFALINALRPNVLGRSAPAMAQVLFAPIAGAIVLNTTIGDRTSITEGSGSGQTIFDSSPRSQAAAEYDHLTQELLQCLVSAPHSSLPHLSTSRQ